MNSSDEDFQRSSASGTEPAGVTVPPRYGLLEEAGSENSVGVPMTRAGVCMMSGFAPPSDSDDTTSPSGLCLCGHR